MTTWVLLLNQMIFIEPRGQFGAIRLHVLYGFGKNSVHLATVFSGLGHM